MYLKCIPSASVEIVMDQVFFHSHSAVHFGQLHKRITPFKKKEASAAMRSTGALFKWEDQSFEPVLF